MTALDWAVVLIALAVDLIALLALVRADERHNRNQERS